MAARIVYDGVIWHEPGSASERLAELGIFHGKNTLAKMRCDGGGPPFRYFSRHPRYSDRDLVSYAQSKIGAPRTRTHARARADRESASAD
jgi:hypothetical protein